MSDLFNTGPARHTRGGFTVSHSGAGDIVKKLQKLRDGGEVAIKRTVSDFATRGPGWVSKGIRERTIATGDPAAISWPGIRIGFFCLVVGACFGLILK